MGKIEVGVSMLHCLGKPFNRMAKALTKMAVNYVEIVDDGLHALNKRRVSKLKTLGKNCGLRFSIHAPFADINIASPSKCMLKAMVKRLENSIKLASLLEAEVWVFHPGLKTGISMFYPGADWIQNRETAKMLYKIAQKHDVKIAIENVPEPYPFLMKSVEHFKKFYEEISENIGLALDVGHANINGQIELFLKTFPDKIVHIHAHDNSGKDDEHLGVGHGTVNWKKFAELLRQTAYNKTVVVESVEHIQESVEKLRALLA
ncbi:MAG: sugar phosphate isomerase/epimerase family protein [Candidatus Bathyarchaeia archaeon]|nr:sugar phosphate isomerase/epimerase [Candidatus Bathyarchaeota archaeon]